MSEFRRLRRENKPLDAAWFRKVMEFDKETQSFINPINFEPKPYLGKRDKDRAMKLMFRRIEQKKRRENAAV
tara:strand:- start:76 stop:291 length:216 start_codon:yes stop_codon:yes gene_type:complete